MGSISLLLLSYSFGILINGFERLHTIVEINNYSYVLIESYENKAILVEYVKEKKELSSKFIIRDITNDGYFMQRKWIKQ